MKYNTDQLIETIESGEKIKYVFFWGHQAHPDGRITSSCFSQWWLDEFKVNNIVYRSAEHWMMARKAELFEDYEILEKIYDAKTPAEAKSLGRKVRNFIPSNWNEQKYQIVVEGNKHKFSQNPQLKEYLLQTNTRVLVEASPVDRIWGIGLAKDNRDVYDPSKWRGENLLGFALMEVRDHLIF